MRSKEVNQVVHRMSLREMECSFRESGHQGPL